MTHAWTDLTPRLVATDIDGTIVPHNGTVGPRTRAALHSCLDAGVGVVLVTGRPPRWLPPVVEATGLSTTAICANGAIVIDTATFEILGISPIPRDTAQEVISTLQRAVPDGVFAVETPDALRTGPGYSAARAAGRPTEGLVPTERSVTPSSSIEEMLAGENIFKVVVVSLGSSPDDLLDVVRGEVGELVSVTRSSVGQALVELGPRGVTKASALAEHARHLGIEAADVIAFGDMPNDVEMLRWAGRGYAMQGAHPETVAATEFTAPAAAEDGVAQVLEQMLAARIAA